MHLRTVALLVAASAVAAQAQPLDTGARTLPADAPERPDFDRSPLTGRSREWLTQEITRVETATPSAVGFLGPALLIAAGLLAAIAGGVTDAFDRCFSFAPHAPCRDVPPGPASIALWAGGGSGVVLGGVLYAWIDSQRQPGLARLAELKRALTLRP